MSRTVTFAFRNRSLKSGAAPILMGILNVTPDSFFDGGRHVDAEAAADRALAMLDEGAAIIDIGGESTRPGFSPITAAEETARILPVIRAIRRRTDAPLSIDTSKAAVAYAALEAGADIVNDVSALSDPEMPDAIRRFSAGCVLMHHSAPPAGIPAAEAVRNWLQQRRDRAMAECGLPAEFFLCDPGIGFGKSQPQNIEIIRDIDLLSSLTGSGILLAVSRKSFISTASGMDTTPAERLPGSLAVAIHAASAVDMLRVHDVAATRQAMAVFRAIHSQHNFPVN
jgi:dihydropteroate synthase